MKLRVSLFKTFIKDKNILVCTIIMVGLAIYVIPYCIQSISDTDMGLCIRIIDLLILVTVIIGPIIVIIDGFNSIYRMHIKNYFEIDKNNILNYYVCDRKGNIDYLYIIDKINLIEETPNATAIYGDIRLFKHECNLSMNYLDKVDSVSMICDYKNFNRIYKTKSWRV